MKLLFDQNLSPRLARRLAPLYPGSAHVSDAHLDRAPDIQVWDYALANGYTLVTKDTDFNDISILRGHPPKVIWMRRGNCSTNDIEATLRQNYDRVEELGRDSVQAILMLF